MNTEPNNGQPNEPDDKGKSGVLAIVGMFLAVVPSGLWLWLKDTPAFSGRYQNRFLLELGVSIVCCFVSSALIYRHKAKWTLLIGTLLVLLNIAISLIFGCVSLLSRH